MPFPFLQRESLSEHARHMSLSGYSPTLELAGLLAGIDNVRHDVYLSPTFADVVRQHVYRLLARDGNVEDLVAAEVERPQIAPPTFVWGKGERPRPLPKPGADPADFKRFLTDLMILALNWAKGDGNISFDLLARLAVIKLLRTELTAQFNSILDRLRARQAEYESPRQAALHKGVELRERCAAFQLAKRQLQRKAGQELFQTLREVEKETLARMRRALFGANDLPAYNLLLNRLMFTEDGRDDYINAEHYVMLGNFERDPDRFATLQEIAHSFLSSLDLPVPQGHDHLDLDSLLSVPENAHALVAAGAPDESSTPRSRAQKVMLAAWADTLERNVVLDHIIAAYEAAPLLAEYSPGIHPQQLKNGLINRTECARVERLLKEHSQLSPANFETALRRIDNYRGADRAKAAGRFLRDFICYHRDLRSLEALNRALEAVHIITNDRLRELSAINRTLYEFLLPQEQKPAEDKVINHVVLKADVRDSTTLTRTLMERGLNPASYFSLNFYDQVNKLLPKYQATKVFIEGDAVILALFGYEAKQGFPVARTCVLAREITSIVRAYNQQSQASGLPMLELGIGISFQDSAPMYLMDGNTRIMISKALNDSDRLSSCNRGARRFLADSESLFNVYSFKTVEDEDTGGNPDEFLMRYNVGGVNMNQAAFHELRQEISLQTHDVELPTLWGKETVRL